VSGKRGPTSAGARRQRDRERQVGLDPDDEAARWLGEHEPKPEPTAQKSAGKSKEVHRWRQRQTGER